MAPKNKPNAFLFFMLDWKKDQEKKGRIFPNGLKDVQIDPECNEKWKSLSEHEKEVYKAMGKNCKVKPIVDKKTGLGESVSEIERAQMKEQAYRDNMIEYISKEINLAKMNNAVATYQFYVIHVNYFYSRVLENNIVEYYPAEIAIVETTIEKGVTRTYVQLMNEKVMTGYGCAAKEHSSNSHHIPPNAPFGKSNYQEVLNDILAFLEPGKKNGKLPPLFTYYSSDQVYQPTRCVLSKLCLADGRSEDFLLLYSYEELFARIHNAIIEQSDIIKIEPIIATIELKRDPYSYKKGIECDFHGELGAGVHHCSLSFVKRWNFVLFKYCCDPLGIRLIDGVHKPKESVNDQFYDFSTINSSFSTLSLNESVKDYSITTEGLSMTGVSAEHRQRVSSRTLKEEIRRRADDKPVEIVTIKDMKPQVKKIPEPIERPLRPPHTKSAVSYFDSTDTESIDLSENSFPCIGRGSAMKKRMQENKSYAARVGARS